MLCIKHSVCPVYLLEPTPGMHCPLASGLGTNISSASSLLAPVLAVWFWIFSPKWLTWKSSHNLATMISAAHDLNELGGKHHLLQTLSTHIQMILKFSKSVELSSVANLEKWDFYNYPCAFLVLARPVGTVMQIYGVIRPYLANSVCKYL